MLVVHQLFAGAHFHHLMGLFAGVGLAVKNKAAGFRI